MHELADALLDPARDLPDKVFGSRKLVEGRSYPGRWGWEGEREREREYNFNNNDRRTRQRETRTQPLFYLNDRRRQKETAAQPLLP